MGSISNEASFITDSDYLAHTQYAVFPQDQIEGIALFTDGLEMLALDLVTHAAYEPFFTPLFAFAAKTEANEAELASFLESDRVCARTDDDKTCVLVVRCLSKD